MTAAKLVARFWRFVDSVLTTQKPVRSIYTFAEFDFTAARLVSYSGVARTSPLLGHSMGTQRLYELPREVQKLIRGSWGILPPKI